MASDSASVEGVTITSSSGILWTGEKKCIPSTRDGRFDEAAISAMGSDEVLLANTQVSRVAASTSARTFRFSSRSSNTASITRSARLKPERSTLGESRSMTRPTSSRDRLPRFLRSSSRPLT